MKKKYAIIFAAIVTSSVLIFHNNSQDKNLSYASDGELTEQEQIEKTIKFIVKQEERNIAEMEEAIDKVNKDSSIEKFDIKKAKSRFENTVFIGDSITEYLKVTNMLDSSTVLAVKGEHVSQAIKHLDEIKNLKPKNVVILYGANDITQYSTEVFKQEYIKLVKDIQKVDKGVKIYIQAPIPVDEMITMKKNSKINNNSVRELTKAVKEVCAETGAKFLPSDELVTSKDVYEPDGIHLKKPFYVKWLKFLSENI